jgi:hypothetical protein
LRRRSRSHEQHRCQDQNQLFLRHSPFPHKFRAPLKARVILSPSDKYGRSTCPDLVGKIPAFPERIPAISVWPTRLLKWPALFTRKRLDTQAEPQASSRRLAC